MVGVGSEAQLTVDLGKIENRQIVGPPLPLTGGLGRDAFLIVGLSVLVLGLGVGTVFQVRRRWVA